MRKNWFWSLFKNNHFEQFIFINFYDHLCCWNIVFFFSLPYTQSMAVGRTPQERSHLRHSSVMKGCRIGLIRHDPSMYHITNHTRLRGLGLISWLCSHTMIDRSCLGLGLNSAVSMTQSFIIGLVNKYYWCIWYTKL